MTCSMANLGWTGAEIDVESRNNDNRKKEAKINKSVTNQRPHEPHENPILPSGSTVGKRIKKSAGWADDASRMRGPQWRIYLFCRLINSGPVSMIDKRVRLFYLSTGYDFSDCKSAPNNGRTKQRPK